MPLATVRHPNPNDYCIFESANLRISMIMMYMYGVYPCYRISYFARYSLPACTGAARQVRLPAKDASRWKLFLSRIRIRAFRTPSRKTETRAYVCLSFHSALTALSLLSPFLILLHLYLVEITLCSLLLSSILYLYTSNELPIVRLSTF